MMTIDLNGWYLRNGVHEGEFCVGPEHPAMENLAISFLEGRSTKRVLEIGYQSGGFAIPIITQLAKFPGFHYTGIDNLEFHSNRPGGWNLSHLSSCLDEFEVPKTAYDFHTGDAKEFLARCREKYDLILIDHLKALYVRELRAILQRKLVQPTGCLLLHDVNKRADQAWEDCKKWCQCFHCSWTVHDDVASGLAVVISENGYRSRGVWQERCCAVEDFMSKVSRRFTNVSRMIGQ